LAALLTPVDILIAVRRLLNVPFKYPKNETLLRKQAQAHAFELSVISAQNHNHVDSDFHCPGISRRRRILLLAAEQLYTLKKKPCAVVRLYCHLNFFQRRQLSLRSI
jgi:hypothetical protein